MEMMYQYLWRMKMLGSQEFMLKDGRKVIIVRNGVLNRNSGPDFFNAQISIEGEEWAGDIELHERASDWFRHGHHTDPAYDAVILHVVAYDDADIYRTDGTLIPQLIISLPPGFHSLYETLSKPGSDIRCRNYLRYLPVIATTDWLETLAVQRLQQKSARISDEMSETNNDWEQVCFMTLARGLGFGLNGEPFEMLARSLPLNILHHHSNSVFQIEALLFGQAGMLDSSCHIFDEYYQALCREYYFLARKYRLRPLRLNWKYSRTRPQNFPHRRIAMLANACQGGFALLRRIIESKGDPEKLEQLFAWRLEGYWAEHFSFDAEARFAPCSLSHKMRETLMINVCAPLLYTYGARRGETVYTEMALDLLSDLAPEKNSVTRMWEMLDMNADNALRSQALLQLKREYCERSRCLECRFGKRIIKGGVMAAY
ncbi:MAG: DUF2851 family protein [Muribaculaceae bacterium]|nr:DUF2851 family protein [Muribaculaceae bacterium]